MQLEIEVIKSNLHSNYEFDGFFDETLKDGRFQQKFMSEEKLPLFKLQRKTNSRIF